MSSGSPAANAVPVTPAGSAVSSGLSSIVKDKKVVLGIVAGSLLASALWMWLRSKSKKQEPQGMLAAEQEAASTSTGSSVQTSATTVPHPVSPAPTLAARSSSSASTSSSSAPPPSPSSEPSTASVPAATEKEKTKTKGKGKEKTAVAPITAAAAAPTTAVAGSSAVKPVPGPGPDWKTATYGLLGVTVYYPPTWELTQTQTPGIPLRLCYRGPNATPKKQTQQGGSEEQESAPDTEEDSVPCVMLTIEDLAQMIGVRASDVTVDEYCAISIQNMQNTIGQFGTLEFHSQEKLVTPGNAALPSRETQEMVMLVHSQKFSLPQPGGEMRTLNLKQRSLISVCNQTAYSLQYVAPADLYETAEAEAVQILMNARIDPQNAVLSRSDIQKMSMFLYEDFDNLISIKVPSTLKPRMDPMTGVVASFQLETPGLNSVFSVSIGKTAIDPQRMSESNLTLPALAQATREKIRQFVQENAPNLQVSFSREEDRMLTLSDGRSAVQFVYVQEDLRICYTHVLVENVLYAIIVTMTVSEYDKQAALVDYIVESFCVLPAQGASADVAAASPSTPAPGRRLFYLNPQHRVKCLYPLGWEIMEDTMPGNIVSFIRVPSDASGGAGGMEGGNMGSEIVQLHLMVEQYPQPIALSRLVEHLQALSSDFGAGSGSSGGSGRPQFSGERDVVVAGLPGREFVFRQRVRGSSPSQQSVDMMYLNRCTIRGRTAFYLQYGTGGQSRFQSFRSTAEQVMDSFEFYKPSLSTTEQPADRQWQQ